MLSHLCGSAALYLVEGSGAHTSPPHFFYRPPYYGMGSLLYQMLGGCAPWPGEKGWVTICPMSVCMGYGL
jgi:hypothetical protein